MYARLAHLLYLGHVLDALFSMYMPFCKFKSAPLCHARSVVHAALSSSSTLACSALSCSERSRPAQAAGMAEAPVGASCETSVVQMEPLASLGNSRAPVGGARRAGAQQLRLGGARAWGGGCSRLRAGALLSPAPGQATVLDVLLGSIYSSASAGY